ncbi:MAG: hypothetical protein KAS39_07935, partial [Actinomycetia bacterium]|nr:hypothetical protein [Actinomycetes bacterium]
EWYLHLKAVDGEGNWGATSHRKIRITDDVIPETSITVSPSGPDGDNGWYKSMPVIYLNSNEPATTYYQWDTTSSTWTVYSSSLTGLEGIHDFYYFSVDMADNTETIKNTSFKIDTIKPTDPTSLTSPSHLINEFSVATTIEISFSGATDTLSGVDGFSFSFHKGTTEPPDSIKDLNENDDSLTSLPLSDGSWYFNLRTKDNAGSWTNTVHLGPFKIDTTSPTIPLLNTPSNGGSTTDKTPIFDWQDSIDAFDVVYDIVIDTTPTFSTPIIYETGISVSNFTSTSSLANDVYYWMIKAVDEAGYESFSDIWDFSIVSSSGGGGGGSSGTTIKRLYGQNRYYTA